MFLSRYNLNTLPNDGLMDDGIIEEVEAPITIDEKCIPGRFFLFS